MHLLAKFNIILITVFAIGLLAVCYVTDSMLKRNAQQEVVDNARMMIETALATRSYTSHQITPLLAGQSQEKFLPQSIPSYAATEVFNDLRKKYPDYNYKEATLNPTNPRDKAVDWETDVITQFRNTPTEEYIGVRDSAAGQQLYLSHPIRITNATCLTCHSTPAEAPKALLTTYGPNNGFNWKMGDVVGAQIVTIPMSVPKEMANKAFYALVQSLVAVFAATLLALNIMLTLIVIRPVRQLSRVADGISKGNVEVDDLPVRGKDEISDLAASFNRMQRSLKKAMEMLEQE